MSLDLFDPACLTRNGFCWTGHYVVVVLHVGGSKASDIKLVYNVSLVKVKLVPSRFDIA
jgi:hypothetical protein